MSTANHNQDFDSYPLPLSFLFQFDLFITPTKCLTVFFSRLPCRLVVPLFSRPDTQIKSAVVQSLTWLLFCCSVCENPSESDDYRLPGACDRYIDTWRKCRHTRRPSANRLNRIFWLRAACVWKNMAKIENPSFYLAPTRSADHVSRLV
jgi:hypothetical protein